MQHNGADGYRKHRIRASSSSSIAPDQLLSVVPLSRKSNARSDALGLANTVDPLTFLARKPQAQNSRERGINDGKQQNPRRRRLRALSDTVCSAAEAFSPQKSLRLTKLPMLKTNERYSDHEGNNQSNQLAATTPVQTTSRQTPMIPLHELIQTVDDAVQADPLAELNQSAIARLFMDQWLHQFEADRRNFKSVAVRYEVGFEELQRRTVNLPKPNDLITTFCYKVLQDLTPHFGSYAPLFRVISAEIAQSIYIRDGLSYFALVKHQKRLLLTLRKDKEWREERNEVSAEDIGKVYSMFRHFLSECSFALSRMVLREWHSVAVIQKKNNRKYVVYFSNWFSVAPKSILQKVFFGWKREAARHRIDLSQKQMQIDLQILTAVKRQVDELTQQRDLAQADNLRMRTDRKEAEEWTRQLELRINAASLFLDTTRRRETPICQEAQLRVEAVACLPPLILESLLRGYYGVGFLQHNQEIDSGASALVDEKYDSTLQNDETQGSSSVLTECLAEIARLRSLGMRQTSSSTYTSQAGPVVTSGRSNSVVFTPLLENGEHSLHQVATNAATSSTIRRTAGGAAVSQDEMSGRIFEKLFISLRERILAAEAKILFTPTLARELFVDKKKQKNEHENSQMAREYEQLLRAIRTQDEHYASNSKLFSSRMLENHEISLVPNLLTHNRTLQVANSFTGSDNGDLGVINGVRRLSVATPAMKRPSTFSRTSQLSATRRMSVFMPKDVSLPPTPLLESLELLHETDFDISPHHSRGFTILLLAHLATAYGSLLFSPADMSAFTHNAYLHPPSEKENTSREPQIVVPQDVQEIQPEAQGLSTSSLDQSLLSLPSSDSSVPELVPPQNAEKVTIINHSLLIIEPIVTAYSTWNQISEKLISANVVQSRGLVPQTVVDASIETGNGEILPTKEALMTPIRPILQHQFEPLSHSYFLATRDKGGRRMSSSSGDGNTYQTARIRYLTADGPEKLIQSMKTIHKSVKATSAKMQEFQVMHQQLQELRVTQWHQASELSCHFESKPKDPVVSTTAMGLTDTREQVFNCISLTNSTMRRLFIVEVHPENELIHVRTIFDKHQRIIRQLYTPFRSNMKHAMSLDDLWHFVKILRLPREIHVLPILRDEQLVANGYEQLFSPEDLGELLLQLCNEQFQPQIVPLSARVEYFTTHHLPLAIQNRSLTRVLMQRSDITSAIGSHSQTIRIIFRRYCAKEREVMTSVVGTPKQKSRHTAHGITKYMRMIDWQAFVQDYHLVRARFSMDQALNVFRNVQEATPGYDDHLELIYSEFCEALVGMAMFYFPDPFLNTATKVTQFLRRYLPLSPDEAHDHA